MAGLGLRRAVALGLGLGLALGTACGLGQFKCSTNAECSIDSAAGICQPDGFCSFPDASCPSGQRYGELAEDGVAGKCVPPGVATGVAGTGSSVGSDGDGTTAGAHTGAVSATGDGSVSGNTTTTPSQTSATTSPPPGSSSDETGPPPGPDPYGPCPGCVVQGAQCLSSAEGSMCSPPCSTAAAPSAECPESLFEGWVVGCLYLDMLMVDTGCFMLCDGGGDCPGGMVCALGMVCSWD